jgi:hypothetical protein
VWTVDLEGCYIYSCPRCYIHIQSDYLSSWRLAEKKAEVTVMSIASILIFHAKLIFWLFIILMIAQVWLLNMVLFDSYPNLKTYFIKKSHKINEKMNYKWHEYLLYIYTMRNIFLWIWNGIIKTDKSIHMNFIERNYFSQ